MNFQQPYFSDALRTAAIDTPVHDVHNFLSCDLGRGEIIIDITFPARLGRHGFPVTNDWDGKSDFTLCCKPQERIALDDLISADQRKRSWLRSLNTDQALQLREAAITEMTQWLTTLPIHIRRFQPQDADALAQLLHESVRQIGIKGYSQAQVEAWSPSPVSARHFQDRVSLRPKAQAPFL